MADCGGYYMDWVACSASVWLILGGETGSEIILARR